MKELRASRGITQIEIAKMLGLNQSCYAKRELGLREFKVKELQELKKILNVSYDELIEIIIKDRS